jgi:hypothetical protein
VNIQAASIPAKKMPTAEGAVSGSNLIVEGQFVAIHEGDETKRIMIGFGRVQEISRRTLRSRP